METRRVVDVKDAYRQLAHRKFQHVEDFLVNREKYDPTRVAEMGEEYKRFIAICAVYATKKTPIPISSMVDPFWHAHILFTHDYVGMATDLGLAYFHHTPAHGDELLALEPFYERTLQLYAEHFGAPNQKYWPQFAQICGLSGCSCSGTGNE